jgi:hypothetical protein
LIVAAVGYGILRRRGREEQHFEHVEANSDQATTDVS